MLALTQDYSTVPPVCRCGKYCTRIVWSEQDEKSDDVLHYCCTNFTDSAWFPSIMIHSFSKRPDNPFTRRNASLKRATLYDFERLTPDTIVTVKDHCDVYWVVKRRREDGTRFSFESRPLRRIKEVADLLNKYDPDSPHYYLNGKKRKVQNVKEEEEDKPPSKKRKIDDIKAENQSSIYDSPAYEHVKIALEKNRVKKELDTLVKTVEEHIDEYKTCHCGTMILKSVVKPFDAEGNPKKNAGNGYWSCKACGFFYYQK